MALKVAFFAYAGSSNESFSANLNHEIFYAIDANSQNTPLLESDLMFSYAKGKGGGDIEIVEESALIAEVGPAGTGTNIVERKRNPDEISVYIVRPGDTLSEIAQMFDVTENTITWANDISSKTVKPGQELAILPVTGVRHNVKKGDTLESISKKYKGDINEIALFNGKGLDQELSVGESLMIPYGIVEAPAPAPRAASASVARQGNPAPAGASSAGGFIRPVNGTRTQGIHGFNAVDFGAPTGTPVWAAAAGEVIISRVGGWNGGYGNYIVIKHPNGTQTLYSHLSRNSVSVGQRVTQGQVIGAVGNTGRSTGPHLHFEVRGGRNPF